MKRILTLAGLIAALLTPNAFAANLETRTYDDGGDSYFPLTVSNVAWDSIEKIPHNAQDACDFFKTDIGVHWTNLLNFGNESYFGDIINSCKIRFTSNNDGCIWIGAGAPCTINFDKLGTPYVSKLNLLDDTSQPFARKITLGNAVYECEQIDCEQNVSLSEGMYLINNYNPATEGAGGGVYAFDYIINVKNPDSITKADAYIKLITKKVSYTSQEDYENKTNGNFYEEQGLITFKNQVPVIVNDRTLVPMRDIFEALNCKVSWDGDTQTVTATNETGVEITLNIGNKTMTKNGEKIELDVAPQIINDSTMVPVRAISEALDLTVEWNGDEKLVLITKDETM